MELNIICKPSAFKHKFTLQDIRSVFLQTLYDGAMLDGQNRFLRIGFGSNLDLLEVMYNEVDSDTICVFHMMKCRESFLYLIA
jgi:uncharacterized DUF497 family protein